MYSINRFPFTTGAILSLTLLLSACGGSSSSSSSSGGPTGGNGEFEISMPTELNGLTGDADNQDLLYFTQSVTGNAGLFSINPASPTDVPVATDSVIGDSLLPQPINGTSEFLPPVINSGNYDRIFFAIHEANLNETTGTFDDFRIARIFYGDGKVADSEGYQRVNTDVADQQLAPAGVSTDPFATGLIGRAIIQNDLQDADNTSILYNNGAGWQQIHIGDGDDVDPLELDERFDPIVSVFDPDIDSGAGYLVIDENDGDSLRFIDTDLEALAGRVGGLDSLSAAAVVGPTMADGSVYIALRFGDDDDATLWYYQRPIGGIGNISEVTNAGQPLEFGGALLGPGDIATPAENHIALLDGDLYFLHPGQDDEDLPQAELMRLADDSWTLLDEAPGSGLFGLENAFLLAADGRLAYEANDEVISINADGSERIVLDSTSDIFGQDIDAGILGTGNGWLFYNRTVGMFSNQNIAVASRIDGSKQVELSGWTWVGASTGGSSDGGAQLDALSVSEVFMVSNDRLLAAISVSDPDAGMVNFGTLPNSASEVKMFGIAPGPHRLLQTTLDGGGNDSHEVIYVDTRDKDSMRVISSQASGEDNQRPISRF